MSREIQYSSFPTEVDPLLFYQDLSIDQKEIADKYYELIRNEQYQEAADYLANEGKDLNGLFARFMNLLTDRLYTTEEYLKTNVHKREMVYFETERPESVQHGTIWISKRENEEVE